MTTVLHRVEDIVADDRARMYELMSAQFENVDREQFEQDLDEKESVFVIRSPQGRIEGFSTLVALEAEVAGEPVVGLFSGDTIIDPKHWADRQFLRVVGQHLMATSAKWPDRKVYWLLLTCTFRSYRIIAAMFEQSAPRVDLPTSPKLKAAIDALVSVKFPREYQREQGVVVLEKTTPVRPGRADVSERHLDDPHVDFFVRANPHFARGDFLCCIAQLTPENLSPIGRRLVNM